MIQFVKLLARMLREVNPCTTVGGIHVKLPQKETNEILMITYMEHPGQPCYQPRVSLKVTQ